MPLEILNFALVLFGAFQRIECAKVAAASSLRIDLSRIQPVSSRGEFANHGWLPFTSIMCRAEALTTPPRGEFTLFRRYVAFCPGDFTQFFIGGFFFFQGGLQQRGRLVVTHRLSPRPQRCRAAS